jgi:hypothetical protein
MYVDSCLYAEQFHRLNIQRNISSSSTIYFKHNNNTYINNDSLQHMKIIFYTCLQEDLSRNNVFDQTKKQDSPCMRVLKLWVLQPQHTFDSTPAKYSLHTSYIKQQTLVKQLMNKNYKTQNYQWSTKFLLFCCFFIMFSCHVHESEMKTWPNKLCTIFWIHIIQQAGVSSISRYGLSGIYLNYFNV